MKENLFVYLFIICLMGHGAMAVEAARESAKSLKSPKKAAASVKPKKAVKKPTAKKRVFVPEKVTAPVAEKKNESPAAAVTAAVEEAPGIRAPRSKLNATLGMMILKGSALNMGMQFGVAPTRSVPMYWGPGFDFSLYSPGSLFFVGGGGWYEFRTDKSDKLILSIGAVSGVAFTTQLSNFAPANFATFLDAAIAQEMDSLFSIRAQFKPGMVGKSFVFMLNFNVSYRFS